jgi:hypothetical protein
MIREMSSKSSQLKIVSSNTALRRVLLLRHVQDHPVLCLRALIFNPLKPRERELERIDEE